MQKSLIEPIAVVDGDNRFLRWEERTVVHEQRLVHRSVHIAVYDSRGRLLVQRRLPSKQTYPDHWDLSASGHVDIEDYCDGDPDTDLDAVYERAARRELEEELGLEDVVLEALGHFGPEDGRHYEQFRLYRVITDQVPVHQVSEVAELRWLDGHDITAVAPHTDNLTWFSRAFTPPSSG